MNVYPGQFFILGGTPREAIDRNISLATIILAQAGTDADQD
jgi:hypothetical protein